MSNDDAYNDYEGKDIVTSSFFYTVLDLCMDDKLAFDPIIVYKEAISEKDLKEILERKEKIRDNQIVKLKGIIED